MYGYNHGRFTSPDPYNIVLESQNERNKEKAREKLTAYLNKPQQWNRYTYVINNPLSLIDPTGEILELTGTEEEKKYALKLLRDSLGEAGKNLQLVIDGGHTYVTYVNNGLAASGGDYGKVIEEIIDSTTSVEFQVTDNDKVKFSDGSVQSFSTYGGAITRAMSGTHIQVFISKTAETTANELFQGKMFGEDGSQLRANAETIVSHDMGHAWGMIKDDFYNKYTSLWGYQSWAKSNLVQQNQNRSVQVENMTRQRLGLPKRKKHH